MAAAEQENNQPMISIDKIYVKDISLEIPHSPQIFLERDNPQIEVQVENRMDAIEEGLYEVVVMATVTARIGERVMFLIEVHQAGIFQVRNISAEERQPIFAVMCPNILFPYLREAVSDISVRAGFAPAILNPANFEAIYRQNNGKTSAGSEKSH